MLTFERLLSCSHCAPGRVSTSPRNGSRQNSVPGTGHQVLRAQYSGLGISLCCGRVGSGNAGRALLINRRHSCPIRRGAIQHSRIADCVVIARQNILDARLCVTRRDPRCARQRGVTKESRHRRHDIKSVVIKCVRSDLLVEVVHKLGVARTWGSEHASTHA